MPTLDCPGRNMLLDYLVGKLPDESSESLASHLDTCPECQAELATLSDANDTLIDQLRRSPSTEGDPLLGESECNYALVLARAVGDGQRGRDVPKPAISQDSLLFRSSQTLDEYRIVERLGSGGMGTVYKAVHTRLDRVVALKILPRAWTDDARAVGRFEREMKAIGRLDHPNIVRAYDAREIEGRLVLVMEFVEGLDLGKIVRRLGGKGDSRHLCEAPEGPFRRAPTEGWSWTVPFSAIPVPDACELARQTAVGLQTAHEHGLVHRDVKPSNLMLTPQGQVKVLDLGLARFHAEPAAAMSSSSIDDMTDTGQAMGTADYMAPEQVSDSRAVDIRADIYGLGATLYKLLAGRAPFEGPEYRGTFDKMVAHQQTPIPPVRQFRSDVPAGLAAVLDRMLVKNPEGRFSTPAEVAEALAPWCFGSDLPAVLQRALAAKEAASSPLPLGEGQGEGSVRQGEGIAAAKPQAAGKGWKSRILHTVALLLVGGIGFAFGALVLRIQKDDQTFEVHVPKGSIATVDDAGNVTLKLAGEQPPAKTFATSSPARDEASDGWLERQIIDLTSKLAAQRALVQKFESSQVPTTELDAVELDAAIANDPVAKQLQKELALRASDQTYINNTTAKGRESPYTKRYTQDVDALKKRYDARVDELRNVVRAKNLAGVKREITKLEAQLASLRAQRGTAKEAPLQFAPATECVVNAAAESNVKDGQGHGVNLVNGTYARLPKTFAQEPEGGPGGKLVEVTKNFIQWSVEDQDKWCSDNHVNLLVGYKSLNSTPPMGTTSLIPKGLKLAAIRSDQWEGATREELLSVLASPTPGNAPENQEAFSQPIANVQEWSGIVYYEITTLPATFAFQTRDGNLGILQVLRFTDGPPGVRLRFKLAQPRKDVGDRGSRAVTKTIKMMRDGSAALDDKAITLNDLAARLEAECRKHGDVSVAIVADPGCKFPDVVAVFDACKRAGITRLTVASQPGQELGILTDPLAAPPTVAFPVRPTFVNPAADVKALQGQWEVVSVEKGSNADLPLYGVQSFDAKDVNRISFDERHLHLDVLGQGHTAILEYGIDPEASPKTIDIFRGSSKTGANEMIARGVYELDGDALKICLTRHWPALTKPSRPRDFAIKPDSTDILFTLKRHHPTADEAAVQGQWALTTQVEDGKPQNTQAQGAGTCLFSGDHFWLNGQGGMNTSQGQFVLDSSKEPKTIDMITWDYTIFPTQPQKQVRRGIYKLDSDRLTIAYRKNGLRPDKFESAPGSGVTLLELERPKAASAARPAGGVNQLGGSRRSLTGAVPAGGVVNPPVVPRPATTTPSVNPAAELKALQGEWKVVSAEIGKATDVAWPREHSEVEPGQIEGFSFIGQYLNAIAVKEGVMEPFLFTINPTTTPKSIIVRSQTHNALAAIGIYEFKGDQLRICLTGMPVGIEPSPSRPQGFAVQPESGDVLFTLERYRPSDDEKAIKGDWSVVVRRLDGKEIGGHWACRFGGRSFSVYQAGPTFDNRLQELEMRGVFSLTPPDSLSLYRRYYPFSTPNRGPVGEEMTGIYKLDADRLTIAYRKSGPRPEKFESTPGSGITLLVLERPKPADAANPEKTAPAASKTAP